jgi:predicted benzoate:H+ symporter BenE
MTLCLLATAGYISVRAVSPAVSLCFGALLGYIISVSVGTCVVSHTHLHYCLNVTRYCRPFILAWGVPGVALLCGSTPHS